jgi:O-antigen/teichoic acid export membrane protein
MGLTSNILKHSFIYSVTNVLGKLVSFILLPFYAHIFDTQGYGIIAMVDSSIGILSILFGSAISDAVYRAYHEINSDNSYKQNVITTSLYISWIGGIILVIIPIILSKPLSTILLGMPGHWFLLIVALIHFLISLPNLSCERFLLIQQKSTIYSLISISRLLIGLSLNIWLVIILKIGVIGIFWSSLITSLILGLFLQTYTLKKNGIKYNIKAAKAILAVWIPLIPGDLIHFIGRQADRFFVRFLLGLNSVGILEMAYKFPPLLVIIVSRPFTQAWKTKNYEIAYNSDAPYEIGKMFTLFFYFLIFGGLILAINIESIIKIMTPESFVSSISLARIEIITTILNACTTFFYFGLVFSKQAKKISFIKIIMAIIKICLCWTLIYYAHLKGAAISALITSFFTFLWIFISSQRYYKINIQYQYIFAIMIVALLFYNFLYLFNSDISSLFDAQFIYIINNLIYIFINEHFYIKISNFLLDHSIDFTKLFLNNIICSFYLLVLFYIRPDFLYMSKSLLFNKLFNSYKFNKIKKV